MSDKAFEFKTDPDNDMILGADGCHYDTIPEAAYGSFLELCGCGNPEDIHLVLIEILQAQRDDHESLIDIDKVAVIVEKNKDQIAEMVLHVLERANLIEHGTSVRGSWPTERGYQFIEIGPHE